MPLVYVHGVGNREENRRGSAARLRDELFRAHLLTAIGHEPAGPDGGGGPASLSAPDALVSPFWGSLAGKLHWNGRSNPLPRMQRLAAEESTDVLLDLLAEEADGPLSADRLIVDVARTSLPDAIDLLFTLTADTADREASELGMLAGQLVRYCEYATGALDGFTSETAIPWWEEVRSDTEFLARLREESAPFAAPGAPSAAWQSMGDGGQGQGWAVLRRRADRLRHRADRLRRGAAGAVGGQAARGVRWLTRNAVPRFVGDVTTYLAQRGTPEQPGPIVREVVEGIERAVAGNRAGLPLVVVAHSMGGNIVYDVLSHFRPDLTVDTLVTVGSQVGLFEELKLFGASRPEINGETGGRVPLPPGLGRWINVVDHSDLLAYRVGPIFDGAEDYAYPSGAAWAHTAYLVQPCFHARLARLLRTDGEAGA
ncbi:MULTISPECIES: hypothetical protein [Streptomyces]|uniref:hypothetical protein n=1 Tax=Streptomyces TaxID=1883 RepID=UPI0013F468ED|nr:MULTISPECIES: hypothetical protein [Streptomyces]MBT3072473.1 hypothetical protein [Streptomyces sp. COG21]MBT3080876.1 hypothetical protein [Streptomyces sp. COG20]MBT3086769.1 hypothetical protein [Streptomyces sp. CYG21]MBT3099884.1 hypothetical protein [Streptomyces sp. CBG30]MBT3102465.1 hypothetical protein [Streptomyces sp. COG19]